MSSQLLATSQTRQVPHSGDPALGIRTICCLDGLHCLCFSFQYLSGKSVTLTCLPHVGLISSV